MITLIFHHDKKDWVSRLIAWFTHAQYTHVALLIDEGTVLESSGVGEPQGVRVVNIYKWQDKHPGAVRRYVHHPDPAKVKELCLSKVGDGYDWWYLWGYIFRRNWQSKTRWTCNELITWACAEAGYPIINMEQAEFLTSQHLYLISQE